MSSPAPLTRRAHAQPVKGSSAFDVILSGIRERSGLTVSSGQWAIPERVPVTVRRSGGDVHDVGVGRVFLDGKGNPRVRGMWSSTPLGEYVKALVAQRAVHWADLELEATIDNAGARVYAVLRVVFTMPSDPPPSIDNEDRLVADPAAELLGLAARIYSADRGDAAGLANRVIACAVALGGRPQCGHTHA